MPPRAGGTAAAAGATRRPTALQSEHSCSSAAACSCSLTSRCRGVSHVTLRWIARPVEAGSAASSACTTLNACAVRVQCACATYVQHKQPVSLLRASKVALRISSELACAQGGSERRGMSTGSAERPARYSTWRHRTAVW